MPLNAEEIQAVVAATIAALEKRKAAGDSDMPISNQQHFGKITIPAQSERHVPFRGSYVAIFSNTGGSDVLVSMDNGITNFIKAGAGYPCVRISKDRTTYEPAVYKRVTFANPTDLEMTVEYVLSLGPVTDTRAVVEGWLQVDLSAPVLLTPPAEDVATDASTILAANALLKERLIANTGDYTLWWGDETVDPAAKRGLPIYQGGSVALNARSAVYVQAEDGAGKLSINNTMKG